MIEMSEEWLCNEDSSPENFNLFNKYIIQITNYFFDEYRLDSSSVVLSTRKNKLNLIRQVLIKNLGVHEYIIYFLKSNFYLIEV